MSGLSAYYKDVATHFVEHYFARIAAEEDISPMYREDSVARVNSKELKGVKEITEAIKALGLKSYKNNAFSAQPFEDKKVILTISAKADEKVFAMVIILQEVENSTFYVKNQEVYDI